MAGDELGVFRDNFDRLKAGLDVEDIASAAYSAGLISQADLEQCLGEPRHRRATVFVAAVERGVMRDEENFYKFLKLLKEVPAYHHLIDGLR